MAMTIRRSLLAVMIIVTAAAMTPVSCVYADAFAETEIPASCRVSREVPGEYRDFTYMLSAVSDKAPMPEGSENGRKTVHMERSGKIRFGTIEFSHPDIYEYTLMETTPEWGTFRRDHSVYHVRASVDAEGKVRITAVGRKGEKPEKIIFRNSCGRESSPKTGDRNAVLRYAAAMIFSVSGIIILILHLRKSGSKKKGVFR